jgi:predicted amidophosphoribosyltransferase
MRPARRIGSVPWPVHAPLPYAGDGERWLRRVKYPTAGLAGLDADARALVRALAERSSSALPPPDAIVPVPLHPSALRRRSFNPALRWATALARATGARVHARALTKKRATRPQKGLGVAARRENVRGAFALDPRHGEALHDVARIWLVDDVVTTGSTLEACIEAFRSGGFQTSGLAVCIARTPRSERTGQGGRI